MRKEKRSSGRLQDVPRWLCNNPFIIFSGSVCLARIFALIEQTSSPFYEGMTARADSLIINAQTVSNLFELLGEFFGRRVNVFRFGDELDVLDAR